MEQSTHPKPPSVAFSTFLTGIEALQLGVPEVMDKSIWRSFSYRNQMDTLNAFKFLGLCAEDGQTQPILKQLVDQPEHRPGILHQLLEAAYPDFIKLARANGTTAQLRTLMEKHGLRSDALRKAISFLLKSADFAELSLSPNWNVLLRDRGNEKPAHRKPAASRNGKANGKVTRIQSQPMTEEAVNFPIPPSPPEDRRSVRLGNGTVVTLTVSGSILTLTPGDRDWLLDLADKFGTQESDESDEEGEAGKMPESA